MNHDEFKRYLIGQYHPDPGQTEDGGFLIPNTIMADKTGLIAKAYRWIGRLFRSRWLYEKGTYEYAFRMELLKFLGKKWNGGHGNNEYRSNNPTY